MYAADKLEEKPRRTELQHAFSNAWCWTAGVANITRSIQCVKVSTQQLVSTAKCQALAGSVPENVTECTGTSGCGYGNVAGPWLPVFVVVYTQLILVLMLVCHRPDSQAIVCVLAVGALFFKS